MDLLRIICMLMIVTLHFISHGGLLNYFPTTAAMYYVIGVMRAFSICAVNVFVLNSGYFLIEKKEINVKRILSIALAIWFYSWSILAISIIFNLSDIGLKEMLTSLLPISYKMYWFPTCYLFLCIVSPFLNKLLKSLSKRMYLSLLAVLFICFSVGNEFIPMSDPFSVSNG